MLTLLDAINDPNLFAPSFAEGDWSAWRAFLKATWGLPMTPAERRVYRACTARRVPPTKPAREVWCIAGRRAGKSRIAALCAVYLACFKTYRLAAGERGTLPLIAADRRQARTLLRYVRGLFEACPMLAALVERETAEGLDLTNRVTIEVHAAGFRNLRGYSLVAAVCDEIGFWRSDDSAVPDREVLTALRPGLATTGGLLLCISSPYARRGVLWDSYKKHHGKAGDVLTWQAPSRTMNATLPQRLIDAALEEDEPAARAEWFAEFRRDVEGYVTRETVDAATIPRTRRRGGLQHGTLAQRPHAARTRLEGGELQGARTGRVRLNVLRPTHPTGWTNSTARWVFGISTGDRTIVHTEAPIDDTQGSVLARLT